LNGKLATRYEHWSGSNPVLGKPKWLRTWAEAGTVKIRTDTTPKLADRMYDPKTKRIRISHDVVWLRRMFFEKDVKLADDPYKIDFEMLETQTFHVLEAGKGTQTETVKMGTGTVEGVTVPQDDAKENPEMETVSSAHNLGARSTDLITTRSGRSVRAPQRLSEELDEETGAVNFEIKLTGAEETYYKAMSMSPEEYPGEIALVGAAISGGFTNTTELHVGNFEEAMSSPDRAQVEKAIEEEHNRMIKSKVNVPRSSVNKKDLIDSTWSIKKKSDGMYRARVVARGFKQIDGIHYHEDNKLAPVVNDMMI
jgi:hypothetical protein